MSHCLRRSRSVFKVEDVATADNANVSGNEDCVKEAAEACPVSAISVEELLILFLKNAP